MNKMTVPERKKLMGYRMPGEAPKCFNCKNCKIGFQPEYKCLAGAEYKCLTGDFAIKPTAWCEKYEGEK